MIDRALVLREVSKDIFFQVAVVHLSNDSSDSPLTGSYPAIR